MQHKFSTHFLPGKYANEDHFGTTYNKLNIDAIGKAMKTASENKKTLKILDTPTGTCKSLLWAKEAMSSSDTECEYYGQDPSISMINAGYGKTKHMYDVHLCISSTTSMIIHSTLS